MWAQAGFDLDAFWHQTPDTFSLAMKGVRKRLEREAQGQIVLAWHTGAFSSAAQAGKLKPLREYVDLPRPKQTPEQMLAVLREFKRRRLEASKKTR